MRAAVSLAIALVVSPLNAPARAVTTPPVPLHVHTILPPGENGFYSVGAQAQYEVDGNPADFGPHVDDQRAAYWSHQLSDGDFQHPTGTPQLPEAGVRIFRDARGVPVVFGQTGREVWFGAGYAAATDRLFELDGIRRTAEGTLAELTGPSGVPADIAERTITYTPAEYDAMLARLSPRGREAIEGYAAGVEARIREVDADPSQLPAEYALLQTTPRDWTVEDTLAAGAYITRFVAAQGGAEMANVASLQRLESRYGTTRGEAAFQELYPDDDPHAVTTVQGDGFSNVPVADRSATAQQHNYAEAARYATGLSSELATGQGTGAAAIPGPLALRVPETATAGGRASRGSRVAEAVQRLESWRAGLHGGSFAYALSGRRTRTGGAMLVSNPQLDYSYPPLLWELEVHGGGYDARGVGVPGIPTVGIGHTATVAWGLTTGYSKTIDSFVETTRTDPKDPAIKDFLHNGAWYPESCRTETVRYRQAPQGIPVGPAVFSQAYQVCRTVHGPVVATTRDGRFARAVDYAMWDHEVDTIEGILDWDRARTLADVAAGVSKVTWNENVVAADSGGHIGYWHPGRYFRRPPGVDQRFPLDGRGRQDPQGFLSFAEMPHVVDPASGYVANWNTKAARGWLDGDLSGTNTMPGGPASRLVDLTAVLAGTSRATPADLMRIDLAASEADHRARGYLPALRGLARGGLTGREREALTLLDSWDGRAYAPGAPGGSSPLGTPASTVTDGPAATLFLAIVTQVKHGLFAGLSTADRARLDTLSPTQHLYDVTPLDNLALRVLRPGWAGLPPPSIVTGSPTPRAVLLSAIDRAVAGLQATYGDDPSRWRRPHGVTLLSSLTGVIGPSASEPFEDRGLWVQQAAFGAPVGGPDPLPPAPVALPRTGSGPLVPLAAVAALGLALLLRRRSLLSGVSGTRAVPGSPAPG